MACKQHKDLHLVEGRVSIIPRYKHNMVSWGKRRESTATNGHHVGHFKSASKHKFLSWMFFQRGDIPAITGYAPKRHKKCLDLMILKKAQSYELSTQRTLGLLDT